MIDKLLDVIQNSLTKKLLHKKGQSLFLLLSSYSIDATALKTIKDEFIRFSKIENKPLPDLYILALTCYYNSINQQVSSTIIKKLESLITNQQL